MSTKMNTTKATIFPCLRYRDAPAAIEWLCATFGFEKQAIYPNDDGTIAHAQLTFGDGMIMVGSVLEKKSEWGHLIKQPDEIGGVKHNPLICWLPTRMQPLLGQRLPGQKSLSRSETKTTVGGVSVATIWKVISGASAPTIHGDDQLGNQAGRAKTLVTSTLNQCYGLRTSQAIPI